MALFQSETYQQAMSSPHEYTVHVAGGRFVQGGSHTGWQI